MFQPFNAFFVRTPHSPVNILKDIPLNKTIQSYDFQEAIYIASPILYAEMQKILESKNSNIKEKKRIESALYRYISRMSSRCTPFGLFAGMSVGRIADDKTNIVLGDYKRHSRLDMQFLCTLSQELSKLPEIKENIKFYPNTSIYRIGKLCRYIEYQNTTSGRKHQIVSVKCSVYLDTILKIARKGVKINEILSYLTKNEIEYDYALEYIEELIDSQILVNNLSPSVTGNDYFSKIIGILKELNIQKQIMDTLNDIQEMLHQLDCIYINYVSQQHMALYHGIIQKIKEIKIPFQENCLFQIDMTRSLKESILGKDIVEELESAMIFLNKINFGNQKNIIDQFKQAFHNRYEDREVSLMEVLDPEIGIGYPIKNGVGDLSPLLNDFCMPNQNKPTTDFHQNAFMTLLLKKTVEAYKQNSNEIELYDDEVKETNKGWEDLPPTLYSIFNILRTDTESPLIHVHGFFGVSGAQILTRFAHTDTQINKIVNEITVKENEFFPDMILAEIAHLPDSRLGNVITRPHIRNYEIPYLAQSDLPENQIIKVSDIIISIKKGRICLRSKKLNKEVIPRLTNAHNYSNSSISVYRFLSDFQQQGRTC